MNHNQDWNPQHYLRFVQERTRPATDLLAHIRHRRATRIADLGCGPGNSTELLRRTWAQAQITGVDHSAAMLAKARETLPWCRFVQADFTCWRADAPLDIIFCQCFAAMGRQARCFIPATAGTACPCRCAGSADAR